MKPNYFLKLFFFTFIQSVFGPLHADPLEVFTPNDIFVGDIVEYKWTGNESLTDFPKEEIFSEDKPGLPIGKVLSWEKTETGIKLKIRFYEPGEHIIPIVWTSASGLVYSKISIKVRSNLLGSEKDLEDIEPPEVFSRYLWYLILLYSVLILSSTYLAFVLFLALKSRNRIVDAIWEKETGPKASLQKLIRLQNYLNGSAIYQKELTFLFTSFAKSILSERFSEDLDQKTDSDFLSFIFERIHISMEEVRELRIDFQKTKYTDFSRELSKEDSLLLVKNWDNKLKIGADYGN